MQIPPQITFRNMSASEALETFVRDKVEKLDRYYDSVMSCSVVVEAPHQHHRHGNVYTVHIDVTVPKGEVVVSRDPHKDHSHEDVYVAVRDAFEAAYRQLEEYGRRQRRDVKRHEPPPHGRVVKLIPTGDYGIIRTPQGREVYFHRNSVVDGSFEQLEIGSEVRFDEEMGEKGPQASTVHPIGKHHIVSPAGRP